MLNDWALDLNFPTLNDFIPIPATLEAGKALKTCLRNYPRLSPSSYVREVTAQMALPQPIAYDKILVHEKTKVIGLQGHTAGGLLVQKDSQLHGGSAPSHQVPNQEFSRQT